MTHDEPPEPPSPATALLPEDATRTEPTVDPHNPHDGLFRRIFADPDHAGSLLRAILPPTFVHNADWSTLTLLSGAFVDRSLQQSASDLLFSVQVDGVLTLVQLLIEHQSTPHPHMAWRVLGYQMRASERWLARRKSAGLSMAPSPDGAVAGPRAPSAQKAPLPIVIPIVVYCGERPWNAPLDLDALYGPLDAIGPLTRCAPRTSYLLDDLTALSPAALVARGIPAAGTLALWALRSVARRDAPFTVRHVAHLFDELLRTRSGADAVSTILRYLAAALRDEDRPLLDDTLTQLSPPSKEHSMRTIADTYRDEGRVEGRVEGRADTLLKLLVLKFGPLDDPTKARVSSATLDELDRFTERVLFASTLDEVLS